MTQEVDQLRTEVERLATIVRALSDQVALGQLAARYGPAADSGDADAVAALWTEDGAYDAAPHGRWEGHDAIKSMINGGHQLGIQAGMGHVLTSPHIVVDGDDAQGWGYAMNVRWDSDAERFWVARLSSNHYIFKRIDGHWRITERRNRNMDGSSESRENLRGSTACGD